MFFAIVLEILSDLLFLAPPRSRLMTFTIGAIWIGVLALIAWGLWHLMSP